MPLDYATVKHWRFDDVRQHYDDKDTMLYATYIPGSRGAGNVLFMFGRWAF